MTSSGSRPRVCRRPARTFVLPAPRVPDGLTIILLPKEWAEHHRAEIIMPDNGICERFHRPVLDEGPRIIVPDMDSSESPTYSEQEGSAYNGHFRCTCYDPLCVFNQLGDLERCALRPGNVHSADGWREVMKPVVSRYQGKGPRLYFRGDAAFANPDIYEFLDAEGMGYAIRLPANRILQDKIGPAQEPGRSTVARGAPLLSQLQLSGAELEEAPPSGGESRVASR
jgi:hypothetical protein